MGHKAEIDTPIEAGQEELASLTAGRSMPRFDAVLAGIPRGVGEQGAATVLDLASRLSDGAELVLYGDMVDLARLHCRMPRRAKYHLCVAVRSAPYTSAAGIVPHGHRGLVFYGINVPVLHHSRVRIAYEYCPACGKTTKDYGGRKHLYDSYGTLMSDVWKDFSVAPDDLTPREVVNRVRDMLSCGERQRMAVVKLHLDEDHSLRPVVPTHVRNARLLEPDTSVESELLSRGKLLRGDVLHVLGRIPANHVDLAFADPPYNLAKRYSGYDDRVDVQEYFAWCDTWLSEYLRVLKPGGILAVVNIPLWTMRHLAHLDTTAEFCNWVVWDAMSMPVRNIMPSHYAILLYRKRNTDTHAAHGGLCIQEVNQRDVNEVLPLPIGYCRRPGCIGGRRVDETIGTLTDLWTDTDRLKHNTLRWDHPCQLPSALLRRIIACTTSPESLVLDAFNGIGTTTLVAQQMDRRFIGGEISEE
ncbi:MAG: hypothetical protein A2Z18_07960, partial [Armatimonadetes bacterium RBG_16_58_9]